MSRRKGRGPTEPAPVDLAWLAIRRHPLFGAVASSAWARPLEHPLDGGGWGYVDRRGTLYYWPKRPGTAAEWTWVLAYLLTHLGMGHLRVHRPAAVWVAAADAVAEEFVDALKVGRRPDDLGAVGVPAGSDPERLFERWCATGIPLERVGRGVSGTGRPDLELAGDLASHEQKVLDEQRQAFEWGLSRAVSHALELASGRVSLGGVQQLTPVELARRWLLTALPLLGALAAGVEIREDAVACDALDISIAAVDPGHGIVYVNPRARLDEQEARFVLAHELLHAGLAHDRRRQGRDPFLWNVACDYVINGWLVEMGVGRMPELGCLYDPELAGLSAEAVYDRIADDLRRLRKLATLRGHGACDVLEQPPEWWRADGMDLDAFYRRALAQGLELCVSSGRGFVPAGLVEAIRALAHPPVPWDVELARWFDRWFAPLHLTRTYARPSRRQDATPDVPRPRSVLREEALDGRTFGVVLDTSGSMESRLLGKALGAVAATAESRDVPAARVVFCDAVAYDAGYLPVASIAGRVRVRGRGGTVLQPGIDLLERAADFPRDGPILVITDGECDVLTVRRNHAFLLPEGRRLPFTPRGPVFRIQ